VRDTDDVIIAQPIPEGPDIGVVSSTVDLTTADGLSALNPAAPDAPPS